MLDIMLITSPIYLTIALGYLATRFGLFAKSDMRLFGRFVTQIALPALLFRSLSQRAIGDIVSARYLFAYVGGSFLVFGLGYLWSRRIAGQDRITAAFQVMGMTCSNSGFVGYPILLLVLPQVAGVALALNMLVENLIFLPLLLAMTPPPTETASGWRRARRTLARLATNPMILGLLAGFLVSLLGWKLPSPIERTVNLLAMTSSALSLFVIGGSLAGLRIAGMGRQIVPVAAGKLLAHPLAVQICVLLPLWLGFGPIEPALGTAAVAMAAAPMLSIYAVLAQAHGQADFASATLLFTTIASFFSLSGLLWLIL